MVASGCKFLDMGHAYAEIELANPRDPSVEPVHVRALADSGSIFLCIPEWIATRLGLEAVPDREVTLADGSRRKVPYAGPVQLRFGNRTCFVGALVFGDQTLLGAVPMEDLDLVINPRLRLVEVNPESPDRPGTRM